MTTGDLVSLVVIIGIVLWAIGAYNTPPKG
jgi:hypothetical protein